MQLARLAQASAQDMAGLWVRRDALLVSVSAATAAWGAQLLRRDAKFARAPPSSFPLPTTRLAPSRHKYYRSLLQCAEALCCDATASLLSWHSADSGRTIASAISGLEAQVGSNP